MSSQKRLLLRNCIGSGLRDAQANHALVACVRGKREAGPPALLFASEQHRARIAQHTAFRQSPADAFLQMFPREGVLEVWIEHAMRENKVRHGKTAQPAPDAGTGVAPEPV